MKKFLAVVKDCSPEKIVYKKLEVDCIGVETRQKVIRTLSNIQTYGFVAKVGEELVLYPESVIRRVRVVEVEDVDDSKL